MNKTFLAFLLFISILFIGCEKDFDKIIDQSPAVFQVSSVKTIDSVRYIPNDSLVLIAISFVSASDIKEVFVDVYSSSEQRLNSIPFQLYDNGNFQNGDLAEGDNTYSNKFPLSEFFPVGIYTIKYFVSDKNNVVRQVAIQYFYYNSGLDNIPPVISNLVMLDTVARGVSFIFNLTVTDLNGISDIDTVYFELFRPDSSQVFPSPGVTKFIMHDDGNFSVFGDLTAGDGIYSFKNSFGTSSQVGKWKFIFQAVDRGKKLSNSIIHFIQVQ